MSRWTRLVVFFLFFFASQPEGALSPSSREQEPHSCKIKKGPRQNISTFHTHCAKNKISLTKSISFTPPHLLKTGKKKKMLGKLFFHLENLAAPCSIWWKIDICIRKHNGTFAASGQKKKKRDQSLLSISLYNFMIYSLRVCVCIQLDCVLHCICIRRTKSFSPLCTTAL